MTTSRTDTHAPSAFDPAEYTEVGYFDNHPEDGGCWLDPDVNDKADFVGNYISKGRCDHCGAGPLRYGVVFLHTPSDKLVVVGTTCAGRLSLGSRSEYERKQLLAQAIRLAQVAQFKAASPVNAEIAAWIEDVCQTPYVEYASDADDAAITGYPARERFPAVSGHTMAFITDLAFKLSRYGSLSEKQVAAVVKIKTRNDEWLAQRAEQDAAMANVAPLAEGKLSIEGEIVSTKFVDNDFGGSLKMLVKLDDGNKVWGTMPNAIYSELPVHNGHDWFKGQRVAFNATVERSKDDEHFGFYKRPTKARVLA